MTMYRVTLIEQERNKSELHLVRVGEQWFEREGEALDFALDNTFKSVGGRCVRAHIDRFPTYHTLGQRKAS